MATLEDIREKLKSLKLLKFKSCFKRVLLWFLLWKWLEINGHYVVDCVGKSLVQENEFRSEQESNQVRGN